MYIVIVDFEVSAHHRPQVLAILAQQAPAARALAGNLAFRTFLDAESEGGVRIVHEWRDQTAFDGYEASGVFAALGAQLRPLMTGAPTSRRFQVSPE